MKKNDKSTKKRREAILPRIGGIVGEIAGTISNQKDHLVAVTGNAIETVKTAVDDIAEKRRLTVKKVKKTAKKLAKPLVKKIKKVAPTKKAAAAKKTVKKSAKSSKNKVIKKAGKKK